MTQNTQVFKVDPSEARALRERLNAGLPPDAEWRTVPHARYSVKAEGVVLTCYNSGKLVVQGSDLDTFVGRYVENARPAPSKSKQKADDPAIVFDSPTIGSDEAGKGDYFGPLVVAAVYAAPDRLDELKELGVTDSKALSDDRARRLAGEIERAFDHEILIVRPADYNERWSDVRNVNVLLAGCHADVIRALVERQPEVQTAVVDRFGNESLVRNALKERSTTVERLIQVPRAEAHPVVAAASILARAAFLDGLAETADSCGTDLHKGAGAPVDECGRRVFAIGGRELLGKVAKLHFKNTERVVNS